MSMGKLEAQSSEKLPSQTIINPRENVSAISLRSGREIEVPIQDLLEDEQKDKVNQKEESEAENKKSNDQSQEVQSKANSNILTNCIPLPFSSRMNKSKKEEQEKKMLEVFKKVEVNIPLIDAIKQILRYAKFLKELCTSKKKL